MPEAVHVKFDGCTVDEGLGEGVVRMVPTNADWKFKTHDMIGKNKVPRVVDIVRTQFGLFPEPVRTVQTGQGMNMGALIAMCHRNNGQSADDVWLHIYVMLSRVRHIDQLLIFAMPDRDLFQQGPPQWLVDGIKRLDEKVRLSRNRAVKILREYQRFGMAEGNDVGAAVTPIGVSGSVSADRIPPLSVSTSNGECESEHVCVGHVRKQKRKVAKTGSVGREPVGQHASAGSQHGRSERGDVSKDITERKNAAPQGVVSGIAAPGRQASQSDEPSEQTSTDVKVSGEHVDASRSRKRLPCDMESDIDGALGSQASRHDDSAASVSKVALKRARTQLRQEGLARVDALPVGDKGEVDTGDRRRTSKVGGSGWQCGQDVGGVFLAAAVDMYSTPTARSKPSEEINANLLRQTPDLWSAMFDASVPKFGSELFFQDSRKTLKGIVNIGNTCFITAALQVLLRIQPFEFMLRKHSRDCASGSEGCGLCAASKQADAMRSSPDLPGHLWTTCHDEGFLEF